MNKTNLKTILILLAINLIFLSCNRVSRLPKSMNKDKAIQRLEEIALNDETDRDTRYVAMEGLIGGARARGESQWLLTALAEHLEKDPQDPYGAYYLTAMAQAAQEAGSVEISVDYMRRAVKNYPDLIINGQSLRLLTLESIATLTTDPREAIAIRELIKKEYSASIDRGLNHYLLAAEYRKLGEWDKMYQSWEEFLEYPQTVVPNTPDAYSRVSHELIFHYSNKSWIKPRLEDLIGVIQTAIRTQNAHLLEYYKSKDFFHMSWNQEISDSFTHVPMTISTFLSPRVRYKSEVENSSNNSEAYLWTTGWSWQIPTWYLYFKRINYPADPEIHGQWEWKGIYFGERF